MQLEMLFDHIGILLNGPAAAASPLTVGFTVTGGWRAIPTSAPSSCATGSSSTLRPPRPTAPTPPTPSPVTATGFCTPHGVTVIG
ncbi:hypothetical protein [Kitasatospora sp. NPDC096204]|uniref:hypothetical protein n=1 Tax=Kitasatospora sp. NPDC096204 TaxID=3364094 RepID=UPI00381EC1E2